jgi:hypothetical protein
MPDLVLRFLALARGNIKQPAFRAARASKRINVRSLTVAALNATGVRALRLAPYGTQRFRIGDCKVSNKTTLLDIRGVFCET